MLQLIQEMERVGLQLYRRWKQKDNGVSRSLRAILERGMCGVMAGRSES